MEKILCALSCQLHMRGKIGEIEERTEQEERSSESCCRSWREQLVAGARVERIYFSIIQDRTAYSVQSMMVRSLVAYVSKEATAPNRAHASNAGHQCLSMMGWCHFQQRHQHQQQRTSMPKLCCKNVTRCHYGDGLSLCL